MRLRRFAFVVGALTITVGGGVDPMCFLGPDPPTFWDALFITASAPNVTLAKVKYHSLNYVSVNAVLWQQSLKFSFHQQTTHIFTQFYVRGCRRLGTSGTWPATMLRYAMCSLLTLQPHARRLQCSTLADHASRSPRDYGLLRSLPSAYNHCTRTRRPYTSRS